LNVPGSKLLFNHGLMYLVGTNINKFLDSG